MDLRIIFVHLLAIVFSTHGTNGFDCQRSPLGFAYRGKRNTTKTGRTCQAWGSQVPHRHRFNNSLELPDFDDAANYCRNPDNDRRGVWCYTTDPSQRDEECDVPPCEGSECQRMPLGVDYRGKMNSTKTGKTCQAWSSQVPHKHDFRNSALFPDATLDDAANFCRNPDTDLGGVWCYTTDPNKRHEYCDVPLCKEESEQSSTLPILITGFFVILLVVCIAVAAGSVIYLRRRTSQKSNYIPKNDGLSVDVRLSGIYDEIIDPDGNVYTGLEPGEKRGQLTATAHYDKLLNEENPTYTIGESACYARGQLAATSYYDDKLLNEENPTYTIGESACYARGQLAATSYYDDKLLNEENPTYTIGESACYARGQLAATSYYDDTLLNEENPTYTIGESACYVSVAGAEKTSTPNTHLEVVADELAGKEIGLQHDAPDNRILSDDGETDADYRNVHSYIELVTDEQLEDFRASQSGLSTSPCKTIPSI